MRTGVKTEHFVFADGVHAREFDGELVLLNLNSGQYYALDELGAHVWNALGQGRTVLEFVQEMHQNYDVEQTRMESDVCALVEELLALGLLRPNHAK